MITHYHRPRNMEEALKFLARSNTRPLGGGTILTRRSEESFSVVDLQDLGLDKLRKSGNNLEIGATVTLQALLESHYTLNALKTAIKLETPLNLRTMGTVAGALVTCDGRSPFAVVMLALDAKCTLLSAQTSTIRLGDLLPFREDFLDGKLISRIDIPLNVKLAFETVARTPADKPLVCAALAQWLSGRTRLTLGGWGKAPLLALDGNEFGGLDESARNTSAEAADEWASAEYRMEIAGILAKRCQDGINSI